MKYIDISDVELDRRVPKIDFNEDDGKYELAVSLHNYCNMGCEFCFQSHNPEQFSLKKIRRRLKTMANEIYHEVKPELVKYNITELNVKFWGGELFSVDYHHDIYKIYKDMYLKLADLVHTDFPNIHINVVWLTNGYNINYEYAYKLVKETQGRIALSYDPVGRFKSFAQVVSWAESFIFFYNKTDLGKIILSLTPTKQNIAAYGKDEFFIKLLHFSRVEIDISYYTASFNWEKDMPNDNDMYTFYKFLVDNKIYNCKVLTDILNVFIPEAHHPMYCNCKKAMQVTNGVGSKNCAKRTNYISSKHFYGKYDRKVDESNCAEYKNSLGILKRGCLMCEWYTNCQKTCWISILFSEYKTEDCPLKRIYEYIQSKPDIIEDWRKRVYNESSS